MGAASPTLGATPQGVGSPDLRIRPGPWWPVPGWVKMTAFSWQKQAFLLLLRREFLLLNPPVGLKMPATARQVLANRLECRSPIRGFLVPRAWPKASSTELVRRLMPTRTLSTTMLGLMTTMLFCVPELCNPSI